MAALQTISILLLLYSHFIVEGVNIIRKVPEDGHNVCIVEREKIHITSRKIDLISYVPHKTVTRIQTIDCCPGWENYNPSIGCLTPGACLSITQNTPQHCLMKRREKLKINQAIYTFGKPPQAPTEDLNDPKNLQNVLLFPLLNMTIEQIVGLTARDPHELSWLLVYQYMLKSYHDFLATWMNNHPPFSDRFNSTSNYIGLYEIVRDILRNGSKYNEYFRYPSLEEKFKDIMTCDRWKDDQVFVEQRLAGLNPMSLKRLTTLQGVPNVGVSLFDMKRKFNSNFDWDAAMSMVVGSKTTLQKMVEQNSVFVSHFPALDGLSNTEHMFDFNPFDAERKRKNSTSPIALFVSVKSPKTSSYQLKPVAIQLDADCDSPVFKPGDGNKWLLAKQIFQVADFAYVEMIEHLLKTHLILEPICVVAKRCLSEFHPLSHLLKWHCRGLLVTNTNGLPRLVLPNGYMHRLFAIGNIGSIELLNKAYNNMTWEDTDFLKKFKKRGVKNRTKLPYFPYRDDGYLVWNQVESFVKDYVRLYYRRNQEIYNDNELQLFANELSRDGTGKNGGIGMLKGFPQRIATIKLLVDTLTRILWLPIQHNAVNYPIAYYSAFVPNMPSKVYDDPRAKPDEFSFTSLPQSIFATFQSVISMSLGSIRVDKLLDYGSKMEDPDAAELVNEHYKILTTDITKILNKRNVKRFEKGHLTYPYLVPRWIPNSIYT